MTAEIFIAEWPKNRRETLRVRLDTYQGRTIVDCRCWYEDGGTLKPGRSGLTLGTRHLPALAQALAQAVETATASGLIDADAPQNE